MVDTELELNEQMNEQTKQWPCLQTEAESRAHLQLSADASSVLPPRVREKPSYTLFFFLFPEGVENSRAGWTSVNDPDCHNNLC